MVSIDESAPGRVPVPSSQDPSASTGQGVGINSLFDRIRGLETLASITAAVFDSRELSQLVERTLSAILEYTRYDSIGFFLLSEDKTRLKLISSRGFSVQTLAVGEELPVNASITGLAVQRREIVSSENIPEDSRIAVAVKPQLEKQGVVSVISVPIVYKDMAFGALNVLFDRPTVIKDIDQFLLMQMGQMVGLAISNVRHVERIEEEIGERKKAEEALLEANETLEARVQDRTRELEESNQLLRKEIDSRRRIEQALKISEDRYRQLSITDGLTKLFNSRFFYDQLPIEIERAQRYDHPLSLLMIDVDNFKTFNDTYGHLEGDKVLVKLGKVLKDCVRRVDSVFRYGGEEFAVLLPECNEHGAVIVSERIRQSFNETPIGPEGYDVPNGSVSIGVAVLKKSEDLRSFVSRADAGAYAAKRSGKNTVVYLEDNV